MTKREINSSIKAIIAKRDQAVVTLKEALSMAESLRDQQEEDRDNIPENLQGGSGYEVSDARVDSLDSIVDGLDSAVSEVEDVEISEVE